jgi:hypothetical protein
VSVIDKYCHGQGNAHCLHTAFAAGTIIGRKVLERGSHAATRPACTALATSVATGPHVFCPLCKFFVRFAWKGVRLGRANSVITVLSTERMSHYETRRRHHQTLQT